jgi:hypothetical protein
MIDVFKFKRGDTFILGCEVGVNLSLWEVRSQVRHGDKLVATLVYTLVSSSAELSQYKLHFDDTTDWPIGKLNCDIEYTTDTGQIISTETFFIECIKDSTV